jgi:hypothetical protein
MEGIEEARNMRKLDAPRIRPAISFKSFGAPTSETETVADGGNAFAKAFAEYLYTLMETESGNRK